MQSYSGASFEALFEEKFGHKLITRGFYVNVDVCEHNVGNVKIEYKDKFTLVLVRMVFGIC